MLKLANLKVKRNFYQWIGGIETPNKTLKSQPAARVTGTKTQCGFAIFALCFCPLA